MPEKFSVELDGLRFFSNHGHYAEEALLGNEFEVNVKITFTSPSDKDLSLDQTIDYQEVFLIVKDHLNNTTALMENIAKSIANHLETRYRFIDEIELSIQKLNPPIQGFVGRASVRYHKDFK